VYFIFSIKSKTEKQLNFQQHRAPSHCAHNCQSALLIDARLKIHHAPNLWLLNISDFSPVDYRILAMLYRSGSVNILYAGCR